MMAFTPDQHAFAVNPNNPNQFFEGSDGGSYALGRHVHGHFQPLQRTRA
jgi:hypothetical protein